MRNMYFIRGLPGSGKSTLADMFVEHGLVDCHFEADSYFIDASGGYRFDPTKLGEAHKQCYSNAEERMKQGWNVCISNTSTTNAEVEKYEWLANKYGYNFICMIMETRGVPRKSVHDVPEQTVDRMRRRFEVCL